MTLNSNVVVDWSKSQVFCEVQGLFGGQPVRWKFETSSNPIYLNWKRIAGQM